MERRYIGVIIAVILFLIVSSLEFYIVPPQLGPEGVNCGKCTPWVPGVCGGGECGPHEIQSTRYCESLFPHEEVNGPILSPRNPQFSAPPAECFFMCTYKPLACNVLPDVPFNPNPSNGAIGQLLEGIVLSWDSNDGDLGDNLSYDIYFGETLVLVSSDQTSDTYSLGTLNPGTIYSWQIVVRDDFGAEATGPVWNFVTGVFNDAPTIQLLTPLDGSLSENSLLLNLTWAGTDSDNDVLNYDFYFSTSSDPTFNVTTPHNYTEISDLNYGTLYYWKVNVSDGQGSDMSEIWNFTTEEYNNPPTIELLFPTNESEDSHLIVDLNWSGNDLDGDLLTYDVYFGISSDPPFYISTLNNFTEIEDLDYDTTYYWRVVVTDGENLVSSGDFIFSTEEESVPPIVNPAGGGGSSSRGSNECAPGCDSSWMGDGECDIICNVTECDYDAGDCAEDGYILFDIKVFLEDEYPRVLSGSDVASDIVLYNFGTIRPVDVYLECAIEDLTEDRNRLDFFTETLAVAVQTSINRNLRVPDGTASGRYIYNCYMTYAADQEPIYSGDLFEVIDSTGVSEERLVGIDYTFIIFQFLLSNWIWFVIGLVLLLIILFIIILAKKRKKKKKDVEPVGKGPVAPTNLFGEDLFVWVKKLFIRVFKSGVRQ